MRGTKAPPLIDNFETKKSSPAVTWQEGGAGTRTPAAGILAGRVYGPNCNKSAPYAAKLMNNFELLKEAAKNFLDTADRLHEQVSAYIDGDNSSEAEDAYLAVLDAELSFCELWGLIYDEPAPRPSLNYELAESVLF